jgi:hypothetical protein
MSQSNIAFDGFTFGFACSNAGISGDYAVDLDGIRIAKLGFKK